MTLLENLITILTKRNIPAKTGSYPDPAPDTYVVLTPLVDSYEVFGDNKPTDEVQSVRISLFTKGNYIKTKGQVIKDLFSNDLTITDRRYLGYETETGYHHYVIDVENNYYLEVT